MKKISKDEIPIGKISAGTNVFIYPMPVVLVGAQAGDKANFMAVGWVSRMNLSPPMMAIGIHKSHFTTELIKKNGTFSINIPGAELLVKTDYCGLASGADIDKSKLFQVFYGALDTAPMINECPLCMECKLVNALELPTQILFIGEIVASYTEEGYLSGGKLDIKKMNPLLLTMPDNSYWSVGAMIGKAWSDGRKLNRPI